MRVAICGFYGWSNSGDEGILQAMLDELGDHEYIICTSLPFDRLDDYKRRLPKNVAEVRQIYDVREDYDVFLLGGGALSWGFGWRQAINAFSHDKPSMYYAVGLNWHQLYHAKLNPLYSEFLDLFDDVTVRDMCSRTMAAEIGATPVVLTMCPSINLKEQKFDDCPKNMIAVCPRYEDYEPNTAQLDWFAQRLEGIEEEVLLIPFAPYSPENQPIDLSLCLELKKRLKNSRVLNVDGYSPRKIKYAISQSKLVLSGGRYHALVWAAAHNIPSEFAPTCYHYPKIAAFVAMWQFYGSDKLKQMEHDNVRLFRELKT